MHHVFVSLTPEEKDFLDVLAYKKNVSTAELLKQTTLVNFDIEYNSFLCERSLQEYFKNPIGYLHDEKMKEWGLRE